MQKFDSRIYCWQIGDTPKHVQQKRENGDIEFTLTELLRLSDLMEVSVFRFIDLDIAKIINQQNHDNSTGIIEHQIINGEGYKLCIEQYKEENSFLKEQVRQLTTLGNK